MSPDAPHGPDAPRAETPGEILKRSPWHADASRYEYADVKQDSFANVKGEGERHWGPGWQQRMAEDARIRAESLGYHEHPDPSQRSTPESMAAERPPEDPSEYNRNKFVLEREPVDVSDELRDKLGGYGIEIRNTESGLSMVDATPNRYGAAADAPETPKPAVDPKRFTVEVHGGPDGVYFNGEKLSAKELAEVIKGAPGYKPGEPVRLLACQTGADLPNGSPNFAQRLSKELGVEVLAPNKDAWVDNFGNMYASGSRAEFDMDASGTPQPRFDEPGEWVSFSPDGTKAVHDSPFPPGHEPEWVRKGEQADAAEQRGRPDQPPKEFQDPGGPAWGGFHTRRDEFGTPIQGHLLRTGEFVPHIRVDANGHALFDANGNTIPAGGLTPQGQWVPGHIGQNGNLVPNGHYDDKGGWVPHGRTDEQGRWIPVHRDANGYHDLGRFNPQTHQWEPLGHVDPNTGQFRPNQPQPPAAPQAGMPQAGPGHQPQQGPPIGQAPHAGQPPQAPQNPAAPQPTAAQSGNAPHQQPGQHPPAAPQRPMHQQPAAQPPQHPNYQQPATPHPGQPAPGPHGRPPAQQPVAPHAGQRPQQPATPHAGQRPSGMHQQPPAPNAPRGGHQPPPARQQPPAGPPHAPRQGPPPGTPYPAGRPQGPANHPRPDYNAPPSHAPYPGGRADGGFGPMGSGGRADGGFGPTGSGGRQDGGYGPMGSGGRPDGGYPTGSGGRADGGSGPAGSGGSAKSDFDPTGVGDGRAKGGFVPEGRKYSDEELEVLKRQLEDSYQRSEPDQGSDPDGFDAHWDEFYKELDELDPRARNQPPSLGFEVDKSVQPVAAPNSNDSFSSMANSRGMDRQAIEHEIKGRGHQHKDMRWRTDTDLLNRSDLRHPNEVWGEKAGFQARSNELSLDKHFDGNNGQGGGLVSTSRSEEYARDRAIHTARAEGQKFAFVYKIDAAGGIDFNSSSSSLGHDTREFEVGFVGEIDYRYMPSCDVYDVNTREKIGTYYNPYYYKNLQG